MTFNNFTPQEIEDLRGVHVNDEANAWLQESGGAGNPSLDLELALLGLHHCVDIDTLELRDGGNYRNAIDSVIPFVEKLRDYFIANHEKHIIEIDIKPEIVLEIRNKLIELLIQKGTEVPTSIGIGWRKCVYGIAFNDKLMARGVEIWYPGVTIPTPDLAIDNPVYIKLIDDPDVIREPIHTSLTSHGRASTSVYTMNNDPATKAWMEVVNDIEPGEWQMLLETTLAVLDTAN